MLWPVFANSTSGLLIRNLRRGRAYRYCSPLLIDAGAPDRTRGDPADEDADDDGDDAAGDVDDLRDVARCARCRLRRGAAGEDECHRRRDDAEEGGEDVAPKRNRGQAEREVDVREREDDREPNEED